jgi:hypothetical protein
VFISDLISKKKRIKMEQQQLATMLAMEKSLYVNKSRKSHPKRRYIADSLHKVCIHLLFNKIP